MLKKYAERFKINNNTAQSRKAVISFALFLCVNGLFVLKYAERTILNPILCLFFYCVLVSLFYLLYKKIIGSSQNRKQVNILIIIKVVLLLIGILFFHHIINPYELMVDRWSAIHNFIQNLFQGIYPYSAQTHLNGYGSPFPIWQLYHIPFYLLGNIALGMCFSLLIFVLVFSYLLRKDKKPLSYFLFFLIFSPAFWYEVVVRSDLFYNFLLVLAVLIFVYEKGYVLKNKVITLGIICGLFLSTRLAVVIPFFIFFFPDFLKTNWTQRIIFVISIIIVFIISFLPFIIWDAQYLFFFEYSPFILQSRQGSWFEVVFISLFCICLSLIWKGDFLRFTEYTAYALLVFVGITFLHRIITNGAVDGGIFNNTYDITYFNMALPFLIFSISNKYAK